MPTYRATSYKFGSPVASVTFNAANAQSAVQNSAIRRLPAASETQDKRVVQCVGVKLVKS